MSDSEELRQMILAFRVSELQVLLGFAGKNKSGKKQELQARALELVKMRSTPVQMKIRELHKRIPTSGSIGSEPCISERAETRSSSSYNASQAPMKTPHYSMTRSSLMPMPGSSNMDYGGSSKHGSMSSGNNNSSSGYPVHPDVRFKALPFYDIMGELLKPTSLVPSTSSRFQETNFVFHLTPQQANDIAMSRDIRPAAKNEYSVQVQLRFCLLETSCEQEDTFPPSICVKVNSKICPLPNPIPTNKPGVEPKRPSRPVNITTLCKLCPTVPNYITVSWASEYGRAYVIGVYHVKRLNSSTLLQRLRSAGVRNPDHTRAMIKEKLQQDPDSEIATTSLRGSLMCPLGKMRMHIPCRAKTCTHLQCFDASLYLQMNEKKPTWICPVCDKPALFNNLVIDGLFMEITTKAPSHCTEVQFHDDGNWTPLLSKKEMLVIGGSPSPSKAASTFSPAKRTATSSSSPQPEKKKAKVEVVDLTLDSSTDEYDDETDTSSPMGIPNLNNPSISVTALPKVEMIPTSSSPTSAGTTTTTTTANSLASNAPRSSSHPPATSCSSSSSMVGGTAIPSSIQVISLPSPSSNSSCSNSSHSSHSSNHSSSSSTSSYPSVISTQMNSLSTATAPATVSIVTSASVSSRSDSALGMPPITTSSSSSGMLSPSRGLGNIPHTSSLVTEGGTSSSNSGNTAATQSVQASSLAGNSMYPNMPILDTVNNPYYQNSPFHEYINSAQNIYSNYPGYDLYSMIQSNDSDRPIPSYSTVQSSNGSRKTPGLPPDVISLD